MDMTLYKRDNGIDELWYDNTIYLLTNGSY